LSTGDTHAESKDIVGADVLNLGEVDAVFVAEREIGEEIFEGVDAAFGEEFGALRADSLDHLDAGLQAFGHRDVYIIFVVGVFVEGKSKRRRIRKTVNAETEGRRRRGRREENIHHRVTETQRKAKSTGGGATEGGDGDSRAVAVGLHGMAYVVKAGAGLPHSISGTRALSYYRWMELREGAGGYLRSGAAYK
jgi:hypothetical protein